MIEYEIWYKEDGHDPAPAWGCHTETGWHSSMQGRFVDFEAARQHLEWLHGPYRDEVREHMERENTILSNVWHSRWECVQHTTYEIMQREVGPWKSVPDDITLDKPKLKLLMAEAARNTQGDE